MKTTKSKAEKSFRVVWPKPFSALGRLDRVDWSREILAGVMLAALMIPLNIGYAEVAGLPPSVGLYASIAPMIAYAIFATSRHVVGSPDAAIAALTGSLLAAMVMPGDPRIVSFAYALAIVSALFFFLFWVFRLGYLANYLSRAVLLGLVTALGIEVLVSQIRKIMGVSVEAEGFFFEVAALIRSIPTANLYSVGIGLGSIAMIRVLKQQMPKVPGALVALMLMTVIVSVFDLSARGVSVLGAIPAGLPQLTWPQISFIEWTKLIPGALAIVAVTVAEGLLLARKYAETYRYKISADQEIFAYGAGNLAAGLTGAFAIGSSASRTAAMDDAGANTQWPSIVAAVVVALVLLFFTDLLALLPKAALAGVVANAVLKLIEVAELRELYHLRRTEFAIAVICLLSVLVLGTLPGLVIAFLLTTIEVVRRAAQPRSSILTQRTDGQGYGPEAVGEHPFTAPGIIVYRFGGPLFFANANVLQEEVRETVETHPGEIKWFILDAEAINDIDTTGAEALAQVIEVMHEQGIRVAISRAYAPLPQLLARYGLLATIGEENLYETNRAAVAAFERATY